MIPPRSFFIQCLIEMSDTLFTHYKESEGYFSIGRLPDSLQSETKSLNDLFLESIPMEQRNQKTYHQWFSEFPSEIKERVKVIQDNPFWKQICASGTKCRVENISEMDELYYSKAPGKKRRDLLLYGATSNFDPHIDGTFSFPGVHFYRILIGLTPNKTVETRFLKLNVAHKLQENDFIVFDFDKAQHQVVNENDAPTNDYRIMLKLHFLVCDSCTEGSSYFQLTKQAYILYENITRYCMQTGTDPTTPYEFFIGLLCILGNNYKVLSILLLISLFVLLPASFAFKRNKRWQARLLLLNGAWLGLFVVITFTLWGRYVLTGLR